jgi:hypothetical protein
MADNKTPYLQYKGRPLVRQGNMLYYGSMADSCVVMIQILTTKKTGNLTVAEKVQVQLISTDPDAPLQERILKKSEKVGLFNALEIGRVWLERMAEEG